MDLESLTRTSGEWLKATGPDSDIVMSSRIRLARNLADFSFPSRADDRARAEIEELLRRQIAKNPGGRKLNYISVSSLDTIDRQMLVERQLISREHSETHGQLQYITHNTPLRNTWSVTLHYTTLPTIHHSETNGQCVCV